MKDKKWKFRDGTRKDYQSKKELRGAIGQKRQRFLSMMTTGQKEQGAWHVRNTNYYLESTSRPGQ